jgi:hypothetical protein
MEKGESKMTIPIDIVEKMEKVNKLMTEIDRWMFDNLDLEGSKHDIHNDGTDNFEHKDYYEFADEPTRGEQNCGEYCEQHRDGIIEDCYYGKYYYPTEKGNYFWFDYET